MSIPQLFCDRVTKLYSKDGVTHKVLDHFSLEIISGEMLGLVGTSGSGKSTLMNILGLLDQPDEGHYYIEGQDTTSMDDDEKAVKRNQYFGFVFQQFFLLPRLSALENVCLPLQYQQQKNITIEYAMTLLERVGLGSLMHHRPAELSGGQQQRVAIARALVCSPQVILADEPTGALDPQTADEILSLFQELNQEGKTIVIVTHDKAVASRCERVLTLKTETLYE